MSSNPPVCPPTDGQVRLIFVASKCRGYKKLWCCVTEALLRGSRIWRINKRWKHWECCESNSNSSTHRQRSTHSAIAPLAVRIAVVGKWWASCYGSTGLSDMWPWFRSRMVWGEHIPKAFSDALSKLKFCSVYMVVRSTSEKQVVLFAVYLWGVFTCIKRTSYHNGKQFSPLYPRNYKGMTQV